MTRANWFGYDVELHSGLRADGRNVAPLVLAVENRRVVAPDFSLRRAGARLWHDVRHKAPTPNGCFGLEANRLRELLAVQRATGERIFYTLHNHGGDRLSQRDDIRDWITADVDDLARRWDGAGVTKAYTKNGVEPQRVLFWSSRRFKPLALALWI